MMVLQSRCVVTKQLETSHTTDAVEGRRGCEPAEI